ncbi:MAG: DCC1-like thiol-disulfide oxidoreductase family protein [bacterium]
MTEPNTNDACMIFDDSCPMCSAAARWVEKNTSLAVVPGSTWESGAAGIGDSELDRSVWTLSKSEPAPQSEALAVAYILQHGRLRIFRIAGRIVSLWGIRSVANVIYRWIARNRRRFMRSRG